MTLGLIVRRSLRQHALSTAVTAASIALGAGLLMSVWMVKEQAQRTFAGVNSGFDAVLGARGSKLQLVLNAVFHLESSPGNLRWEDYLAIRTHPSVALAVPLAVGDNYRGWRVVGTTPELFERAELDSAGRRFRLADGRWFDPELREAVVGSFAARRLGLKSGRRIRALSRAGFRRAGAARGNLRGGGCAGAVEHPRRPGDLDSAGRGAMDGGTRSQRGHGRQRGAGETEGRRGGRVSARSALQQAGPSPDLRVADRRGGFRSVQQARLVRRRALEIVAWLVVLVATGSMLASIYNSMNERRRELAILRALGARRLTLLGAVVLEAASIAALGAVAGYGVYAAIVDGRGLGCAGPDGRGAGDAALGLRAGGSRPSTVIAARGVGRLHPRAQGLSHRCG